MPQLAVLCSLLQCRAEFPTHASCSSPQALTRMPRCSSKVHSLVMLNLRAITGLTDQSWQRCSIQAQCRSHSHRHAALVARRAASSYARAPSVTQRSTAARRVRERTGKLTNQPASAPRMCTRQTMPSTTNNHCRDHEIPVAQSCGASCRPACHVSAQGRLDFPPSGHCLFGGVLLSVAHSQHGATRRHIGCNATRGALHRRWRCPVYSHWTAVLSVRVHPARVQSLPSGVPPSAHCAYREVWRGRQRRR